MHIHSHIRIRNSYNESWSWSQLYNLKHAAYYVYTTHYICITVPSSYLYLSTSIYKYIEVRTTQYSHRKRIIERAREFQCIYIRDKISICTSFSVVFIDSLVKVTSIRIASGYNWTNWLMISRRDVIVQAYVGTYIHTIVRVFSPDHSRISVGRLLRYRSSQFFHLDTPI